MTRIAVVGGGAWGTALADLLVRKGETVTLWAREPDVVAGVNREHLNHLFLPDAPLAPELRAEADLAAAVRGAEVVVSSAPSFAVRETIARAAAALRNNRTPVLFSIMYAPARGQGCRAPTRGAPTRHSSGCGLPA